MVTYSGVTILDETYDVCDILKDVDEKCPLSAGVGVCVRVCAYVCVSMFV